MISKAHQYVVKQHNNASLGDPCTVCEILRFGCDALIQSNNGAYMHLKDIDEEAPNHTYKFSW